MPRARNYVGKRNTMNDAFHVRVRLYGRLHTTRMPLFRSESMNCLYILYRAPKIVELKIEGEKNEELGRKDGSRDSHTRGGRKHAGSVYVSQKGAACKRWPYSPLFYKAY